MTVWPWLILLLVIAVAVVWSVPISVSMYPAMAPSCVSRLAEAKPTAVRMAEAVVWVMMVPMTMQKPAPEADSVTPDMPTGYWSRRMMLGRLGLLGVGGVAATSLLSGCDNGNGGGSASNGGGDHQLDNSVKGATDATKAAPGTIRGDLGRDWGNGSTENLVHGSDSPESAAREIALWFPGLAG